ncbi:neprilysin-11 isoform X2 [Adelges cooleyi]|uniref:neprilysin-11 isoform X2 n=1 Tax=Adelges cooleyi TaxID=133065 RepID=UPI00217FEA7B|nr:neprilysin-11 isoform X2 [Adelges cooleyi]XP_050432625.1 neprilysin-11 isoform X2 [Adelges cooleyi]
MTTISRQYTITMLVALVVLTRSHMTRDKQAVCTTPDCLRSAWTIIESMNKSVDPCDDFYEFACGNYPTRHPVPKTSLANDRFLELSTELLKSIRAYMEKEDSDSEPYSVMQSRQLYRSCMATDEMDAKGLKPLIAILDKIELPRVGIISKKKNNVTTSGLLARAKRYLNMNFLFYMSVEPDPKNRTINRITLSKPSESFDSFPANKLNNKIKKYFRRKKRETLASEEKVDTEDDDEDEESVDFLKSFGKYVKGVWMDIYAHLTNETLPNGFNLNPRILQILSFNNEITDLKSKVYDSDDEKATLMSVDEFQTYLQRNETKGVINFKEFFTILFQDVENVTLDFNTDLIEVNNIEYFGDLFAYLSTTTKEERVINIWWEVVSNLLHYTTNRMVFIQNRYVYETTGLENNPSRSIYCSSAVNNLMGMAVSHFLVDLESLNDTKKMMLEMMDNIRWAFERLVKELDWMDEETKASTLQKANMMQTLVGFPEHLAEANELDEYYSDVEVIENDFFSNVLKFVEKTFLYQLQSLRITNDLDPINSWSSDPLDVNAFNLLQSNTITVPAGILQFPFFGHDLQVLNYGFLGTILGHELTHSFDNTGRKYDENGNENIWWTNSTTEEYEQRTECFVRHYESYSITGLNKTVNVSGKLTLNENIADNGGLREALMGYRKFIADSCEEPRLPGLDEYSNEQMFFIAFANNWCEASTTESIANSVLDEHSPNIIRVVAGLANSKEFSDVWHCNKGSKMNPHKDKCKLW